MRWVAREFGPAWAYETARALDLDPPAVHLARSADGTPAAFAAHSANNRALGTLGPVGTGADHRGRGLAQIVFARCLKDLADKGFQTVRIPWVSETAFYERVAQARPLGKYLVRAKPLGD